MQAGTKKKLKIQFVIFVVLFIILEICLRLFGMKPGTLIDDFKVEEHPIYQERFKSDELGINHISPNAPNLIFGSIINKQGFRGKINYTKTVIDSIKKNTTKKIIMIIGDSYVEGCCPNNVVNSFPDILDNMGKYQILNFGVAGTDPVQYKLIAEKYIPELKPDLVITAVYFGNDILFYERKPQANTPLTFPFKNNKWIYSVAPSHLSDSTDYNFKTAMEAYNFYLNHYTLFGKNRNWLEKSLNCSVCFSKLYLAIEHQLAKRQFQKKNPNLHINEKEIIYKDLNRIRQVCNDAKTPFYFVGIPAPMESEENLKEKYNPLFKDINWHAPTNLTPKDYDGKSLANHFNIEGHKKYADFLKKLIEFNK